MIEKYFISILKKEITEGETSYFNITIDDICLGVERPQEEPDQKTLLELKHYGKQADLLHMSDDQKRWKRITNYSLHWNVKKSTGLIKITLEDGVDYKVEVRTARELNVMESILRNDLVSYNLVTGSVASGWQLL